MSGVRGLIDTNILIYLSKGLLDESVLFTKYDELLISRITHMEVLGFSFQNEEEELVKKLVDQFGVLEINSQVGDVVIEIRKKKKIKLPDAIIYATAKVNKCALITANTKDFNKIKKGVTLFNPIQVGNSE